MFDVVVVVVFAVRRSVCLRTQRRPSSAETNQQMAARKANASSVFHVPQLLPRRPRLDQSNVPPQLPPSQLTIRPKTANQAMDRTRSTGQWMKEPEKGSSHRIESRIDRPATTSVKMNRPRYQDDWPFWRCR